MGVVRALEYDLTQLDSDHASDMESCIQRQCNVRGDAHDVTSDTESVDTVPGAVDHPQRGRQRRLRLRWSAFRR